jgi:hypothetical protein
MVLRGIEPKAVRYLRKPKRKKRKAKEEKKKI